MLQRTNSKLRSERYFVGATTTAARQAFWGWAAAVSVRNVGVYLELSLAAYSILWRPSVTSMPMPKSPVWNFSV